MTLIASLFTLSLQPPPVPSSAVAAAVSGTATDNLSRKTEAESISKASYEATEIKSGLLAKTKFDKKTESMGNGVYYIHTHIHTYTRTHAYMHVRMHACTHVCTHACTHICTHACKHACTQVRMHACTHTCFMGGGGGGGYYSSRRHFPLHSTGYIA